MSNIKNKILFFCYNAFYNKTFVFVITFFYRFLAVSFSEGTITKIEKGQTRVVVDGIDLTPIIKVYIYEHYQSILIGIAIGVLAGLIIYVVRSQVLNHYTSIDFTNIILSQKSQEQLLEMISQGIFLKHSRLNDLPEEIKDDLIMQIYVALPALIYEVVVYGLNHTM